ncbi:MAG: lipopolysaccharide biosynthesis protein [Rikenellaceae bacterium]|nr:lipopolysaccharide biosynthesis protein [Rikenellaceae bacterium]
MSEKMLKEKVAGGVAWSIAEKVGSMLLQMVVSIVVARLLVPEDFGVIAILTFFTSLSLVMVDSGFSQTLIRKESPSAEDYHSVFAFNVAVAVMLYAVLVAVAPAVARYYDLPVIAEIAPVLFLLLPINALCVIQNTIFTREFRFRLLSQATFAASLVAGAVAIAMALMGCGVWSLVGQRVTTLAVKTAILWICSDWRPSHRFTMRPVREMAPFSFRLLSTDLIASIYNNISQMFIGKIYSADTLGFFNQAQKFKDLPLTSAMQSVQSVTYPAFSKIGDQREKFAESYRQVLMVVAFMLFPVMTGIAAVAEDLFALLLGEKWMPTVPYLQILCLTGLFQPLAIIAYNILKVKSNGAIILRLEIAKKALMTIILAVTIPHSVMAVAWGLVAMSFCEFAINFGASMRYSALGVWQMVRTLLPTTIITAAMVAAVQFVGEAMCDFGVVARLGAEIGVGVAVYTLLAVLFRLEAVREIRGLLAKMLTK